jgi:hypothetical protein
MGVTEPSMFFGFESCVINVLIRYRHPFMRYWQRLLAKPTVTCSLQHPENERQQVEILHIS